MTAMLNTNMANVKNDAQHSMMALKQDDQERPDDFGVAVISHSLVIEQTLCEVSVDWTQFWACSNNLLRSSFEKLVEFCGDVEKEELVIRNIAPSHSATRRNTATVLAAQDAIVALVNQAMAELGFEQPVSRLALRQGEFDVRFYLGSRKPTDHVFHDDARNF